MVHLAAIRFLPFFPKIVLEVHKVFFEQGGGGVRRIGARDNCPNGYGEGAVGLLLLLLQSHLWSLLQRRVHNDATETRGRRRPQKNVSNEVTPVAGGS